MLSNRYNFTIEYKKSINESISTKQYLVPFLKLRKKKLSTQPVLYKTVYESSLYFNSTRTEKEKSKITDYLYHKYIFIKLYKVSLTDKYNL